MQYLGTLNPELMIITVVLGLPLSTLLRGLARVYVMESYVKLMKKYPGRFNFKEGLKYIFPVKSPPQLFKQKKAIHDLENKERNTKVSNPKIKQIK